MVELINVSVEAITTVDLEFQRIDTLEADWKERLFAVQGHRGSGKTTLLLQYLRINANIKTSIYISLDNFYFQNRSLFETVKDLQLQGYNLFVLDEVHTYPNWSIEIKSLYDTYKNIKIIFTGSSALEIYKSAADLSRRAMDYTLPILSLREFIVFETGMALSSYSLENILSDHSSIALALNKKIGSPIKYFKKYLEAGCYPFYKESENGYPLKLMRTISLVLETDIAAVTNIPYNSIYKMKKLLAIIAQTVPFKPNITQLAAKIEAKRETTLLYLEYLERAGIIHLLSTAGKTKGPLTKPDKIYLENTNISFALSIEPPNLGNLRETFFLSQVSRGNDIKASAVSDFLVNNKLTFEIGGKNKNGRQVKPVKNSYLVKDDLLSGIGNEIPLWLFGFLY